MTGIFYPQGLRALEVGSALYADCAFKQALTVLKGNAGRAGSVCVGRRAMNEARSPDDIGGLQAAVLRTPMLCIGYGAIRDPDR
jgi:hypothetical protein